MRKKIITAAIAISEKQKLTTANSTFSSGKIIFSIRIFLMREDELIIDVIAVDVESLMTAKSVFPRMRYKGKFSISPNLRKKLKTAASTHIISKGLSTDQTTPKTLRRYFNLKSRDISVVSVNQFRSNALLAEASVAIKE